jgi:hypothetical protein
MAMLALSPCNISGAVGEKVQLNGGNGWAINNSGFIIHHSK